MERKLFKLLEGAIPAAANAQIGPLILEQLELMLKECHAYVGCASWAEAVRSRSLKYVAP